MKIFCLFSYICCAVCLCIPGFLLGSSVSRLLSWLLYPSSSELLPSSSSSSSSSSGSASLSLSALSYQPLLGPKTLRSEEDRGRIFLMSSRQFWADTIPRMSSTAGITIETIAPRFSQEPVVQLKSSRVIR